MPIIVLDVGKSSAKIRGTLTRRLLEVRSGLFVGSLSKRATEQMWNDIVESNPTSALLAFPSKNELGIGLLSHGKCQYEIVDNFGIPLVKFVRKVGAKTGGE